MKQLDTKGLELEVFTFDLDLALECDGLRILGVTLVVSLGLRSDNIRDVWHPQMVLSSG